MEIKKKILDKETLIIKDILNSSRMNQYIMLFYMLNNPFERVCTNDFTPTLSNETKYIMSSFKILEKKGLIEMVGKFEKENVYNVPSEKYTKTRNFLINKVFTHLKNKILTSSNDNSFAEVFNLFNKISNFEQEKILKERFLRIENQLKIDSNDAFLQNIKNKLKIKINLLYKD
jgi:hypothetical protein